MRPSHLVPIALVFAMTAQAGEGRYRVVGGQQAPRGVWPDAAGVVFQGNDVGCTGVLIAPDLVLTAGHCTDGDPAIRVILNTNDYIQEPREVVNVSQSIEHPQWWSTYDISLLILSQEAETEPRIIARGCVLDDYLQDGAPVAIVGYGATDVWGTQYGTELNEAFTTVVDHDCSQVNNGCESNITPGGEIGAGGGGVDACYGDSGGPLYLLTDVGEYVVGITSRAFWNVDKPCEDGGIYTRPDAVINWIESASGRDIPLATCNFPPEASVDDNWKVPQGKTRTTSVDVEDPDEGGHSYEIVVEPLEGSVNVDSDGNIEYSAPQDYLGPDTFTVAVTDEGVPAHTVDVDVTVEVVKRGCGCATPVAPASGWLLGLIGLLSLRRRTSQR